MPNNMNIVPPQPLITLGPAWAQQLNTILTTTISDHNHEAGSGTRLSQDALLVDGTFPMNDNTISTVKNVALQNQTIVPTDARAIYSLSNNLYYRNGSGASVQITSGNSLAAASVAGITGLAGSDGEVTYAGGNFTFTKSNGASKAGVYVGNVRVFDNAGAGSNSVNIIQPNVIAGSKTLILPAQNLTLPQTLPTSGQGDVRIDTSGVMTFAQNKVTTSDITNATPFTTPGQQLCPPVTLTGLSGRPIQISIEPKKGVSTGAYLQLKPVGGAPANTQIQGYIWVSIGGGVQWETTFAQIMPLAAGVANNEVKLNPCWSVIYTPSSLGTTTFELTGFKSNNFAELTYSNCVFVVREI